MNLAFISTVKSPADSAIGAIVGVVFMLIAVFNRQFYWAKRRLTPGKPAPRLAGQLLFGGIGLIFFVTGLYDLLNP